MSTFGHVVHVGVLVLATGALGSVIAISEISSRFRDEPVKVLRYPASLIYIALNVMLSLLVLALAYAFNWRFGVAPGEPGQTVDITRVLVAGLGAALVLRSSLMTVRVGGKDVNIGPSAAFTTLLDLLEERIDRKRASQRLRLNYWHDLSFSEDHGALVTLISYSLQRPVERDADRLGALAADLQKQSSLSDSVRMDRLCFALLNIAGEVAVEAAADRIRCEKKNKETSGKGDEAAPVERINQPAESPVEESAEDPSASAEVTGTSTQDPTTLTW
jgi:hypothetical protein